jgi:mRNA-binding protein PUF3
VCRHKFASNVCEKAIIFASPERRQALIAELIGKRDDGTSNIHIILRDPFANFPLQTAITHAGTEQRAEVSSFVEVKASLTILSC